MSADVVEPRDVGEPVTAARPVHPYVHVVIVPLIGAMAVLAWAAVASRQAARAA